MLDNGAVIVERAGYAGFDEEQVAAGVLLGDEAGDVDSEASFLIAGGVGGENVGVVTCDEATAGGLCEASLCAGDE